MGLPVDAGSEEILVVEVDRSEVAEDLVLASEPGKMTARAQVTLGGPSESIGRTRSSAGAPADRRGLGGRRVEHGRPHPCGCALRQVALSRADWLMPTDWAWPKAACRPSSGRASRRR